MAQFQLIYCCLLPSVIYRLRFSLIIIIVIVILLIVLVIDMADDRDGMEASGTRAPRALGHLVFLLINFSDVCSNFISFLQGGKGSGTRVFGQ